MNNPHRVVAQVTSGSTIVTKSQIIYITAVDPATIDPSYTAIVDVWSPTGCPDNDQFCAWKEKIPTGTFYVDGKVYSQLSNIAKVSVYLDYNLVYSDDNLFNEKAHTLHSSAISLPGSGNHRLVVQALGVVNGNTIVIGQLVRYFDAESILSSSFDSNGGTYADADDTDPSWWETCPHYDKNGNVEYCYGETAPVHGTTINEDGQSMKFAADTTFSYDDAFWTFLWNNYFGSSQALPNSNAGVKYARYAFDAYITKDQTQVQALEFQVEQRRSPEWIRNFALQDAYHEAGFWRTYDFIAQNGNEANVQSWQPSGVPYLALTPGCWYHVVMDFHVDEDTAHPPMYRDDALWAYPVSGTGCNNPYGTARQPFSFHNAHESQNESTKQEITSGFSLDTDSNKDPYNFYVDKMNVVITQ